MAIASRSANGGRSLYLRNAIELARSDAANADRPPLAALVPIAEVARSTGQSRTAVYKRWETQQEFWTDLTTFLLYGNDFAQQAHEFPWSNFDAVSVRSSLPDTLELLRAVVSATQEIVYDDPWVLVRAALLGHPDVEEPAAVRESVESARLHHLAATWEGVLRAAGLRLRSPLTTLDLAIASWCLSDGITTRAQYEPSIRADRRTFDDGNGPRPWGLLELGLRSIVGDAVIPGHLAAASPRTIPLPPDPEQRWSPAQLDILRAGTTIFLRALRAQDGDARFVASGHLSIARVAARSGVTRRAVYNVWPSQVDLLVDVLEGLLQEDTITRAARFDATIASPDAVAPIDESFSGRHQNPNPELAFLAHLGEPRIAKTFQQYHRELVQRVAASLNATRTGGPPIDHSDAERAATLLVAFDSGTRRLHRSCPSLNLLARSSADTSREIVRAVTSSLVGSAHTRRE